MITLHEETKIANWGCSSYWGDRDNWYIVLAVHRDSNLLEQSNFDTAEKLLQDRDYAIERFSHWLVGWVDYLLINPTDSLAIEITENLRSRMDDYPILDEDDFSEREYTSAQEYWEWLSLRDRIELCHRFELNPFGARHDYLPKDDDGGSLYDYLRTE